MSLSLIKYPVPAGDSASANNGLSLNDVTVVLGQDIAEAGSPATLLSNREIPLNSNSVAFLGDTGLSTTTIAESGVTLGITGNINEVTLSENTSGDLLVDTDIIAMRLFKAGNLALAGNSVFFNSLSSNDIIAFYNSGVNQATSSRIFLNVPFAFSTFVGLSAGGSNIGAAVSNTAVGFNSLSSFTTGGQNNTAIGTNTLQGTTSGFANIGMGINAGFSNTTGIENIYIGDNTGFNNTVQSFNTLIGSRSLISSSPTGNSNGVLSFATTTLGYNAGGGNIIEFFTNNSTADSCIFIGVTNGLAAEGLNLINTTIIGNNVTTSLSNVFLLGDPTQNIIIGSNTVDEGSKFQVNGTSLFTGNIKNTALSAATEGFVTVNPDGTLTRSGEIVNGTFTNPNVTSALKITLDGVDYFLQLVTT